MGDYFDMGGVNVLISIDKMGGQNGRKDLWWVHRVLFSHDIRGLLHCVRRDYNAIIGFCVPSTS